MSKQDKQKSGAKVKNAQRKADRRNANQQLRDAQRHGGLTRWDAQAAMQARGTNL